MASLSQPSISVVAHEPKDFQPLLQKSYALKSHCSQNLNAKCPKYKLAKITEKGAIFMITWNLFYTIALFSCVTELLLTKNIALILVCSSTILYPVVGLVIDIWIGTFRIIKLSMYFLLASIVLKNIYLLIFSSDVIIYLSIVTWSLAGVCYLASIFPLTTTQLIGASGEELSLTIYWLIWGITTGILVNKFMSCLFDINELQMHILLFIIAVVFFILAYIMMENCSHWLMTKPHLSNPIKQIAKVLNYARKHKIPERRSALTYWEEDYPSRIDLGKEKYGGPFTVEEVEDVKTVMRLMPVIVCVMTLGLWSCHKNYHYVDLEHVYCYNQLDISSNIVAYSIAAVGVPTYQFLVYPLLYKHIPSMLKRIGIGILLMVVSFFSNMILELVTHLENEEIACMFAMKNTKLHINYLWTLIPNLSHGLGYVLVLYCSIEFIIAQTPQQIKGLMMCIALETFGLFLICGYAIDEVFLHFPFQTFPSCGFYYYTAYFMTSMLNLLLFVAISKWYKLRKRDDIVPYHMFAENYFEKNQILEQEYLQAMDDALSRTSTTTDIESDTVY